MLSKHLLGILLYSKCACHCPWTVWRFTLVATYFGGRFLPNFQPLTIFAFLTWPHRKLRHLEVNSAIEIDNDTSRTILRLVDKGINIRIIAGWRHVDYLQRKLSWSRSFRGVSSCWPCVGWWIWKWLTNIRRIILQVISTREGAWLHF